jgi:predicted PurR-regulated permease PerM
MPPEGPATQLSSSAATDRMPGWVPLAIVLFWLGFAVLWLARGVLHSLHSFFIIILISLFLSFAIEPAVNALERRGVRRGIGTGAVFLAIVLSLGGFGFAMGSVLADQLNTFVNDAPERIDDLEAWSQRNISEDIDFAEIRQEFVDGGSASRWAQDLARNAVDFGTAVLGILFQVLTIALFTFYLVADGPRLRRNICSLLPQARQREVLRVWDLAIEKTGGFIASRAVLALLSAIAHWIALEIIGVDFPLPLAIWMGVLSQFIPVVGTYIAGALPVLIAFTQSPSQGLWTLGFVVAYQQVENYILLPRVTSRTMEMHVATAFGSVIVGSAVLGPVGAALALPAAATLQAFISSVVQVHEIDEVAFAASKGGRSASLARDLRGAAEHADQGDKAFEILEVIDDALDPGPDDPSPDP